jgi:tetratricopeptide (TPR) repeat protein
VGPEFQRALDLNPNFLGFTLSLDGRSDQAIEHLELAIRVSPHDPQNALFNRFRRGPLSSWVL